MSRAKGGRTRRKIEDYFRSKGYLVANVEKYGRFTKEKDLFALCFGEDYSDKGFDLLCLGNNSVVFVQCKTNTKAVQTFYCDFAKKYANSCIEVVVATWFDRKGLVLQYYEPDGSITEIDLRK